MNEKNILDEILLDLLDEAVDKMSAGVKKSGSARVVSAEKKPFPQPPRTRQPIVEEPEYDGFFIEELNDEDGDIIIDLFRDFCDGNCDDCCECDFCDCCEDDACVDCEKDCTDCDCLDSCMFMNPLDFLLNNKPKEISIERVVYNDPATVIIWSDGTKTVSKCEACDTYSKETGFLSCMVKKMIGNKSFHEAMHNYCYDALTEDELRMEREKLRLEKKNANNESAISLDGEKALIDGAETIEPESAKKSGSDRNSKKKDDATSSSKTADDEAIVSLNVDNAEL